MSRILIAYDTTEGQTRKIGLGMAADFARNGNDVEVIDMRRPVSLWTVSMPSSSGRRSTSESTPASYRSSWAAMLRD